MRIATYLEQGSFAVDRHQRIQVEELADLVYKLQVEPCTVAVAPSLRVHLASIAEDTEPFFY